jgi:hypothetical protein
VAQEFGHRGLAQGEGAGDVEVKGALEGTVARVEQRTRHGATGVVHDDVEATEGGDGAVDQLPDVVGVVHVERHHFGAAPARLY